MSKEQGAHRSLQNEIPVLSVWAMVTVVTAMPFVVGCSDVPLPTPSTRRCGPNSSTSSDCWPCFVETPGDLGTETYALRVLDAEGAAHRRRRRRADLENTLDRWCFAAVIDRHGWNRWQLPKLCRLPAGRYRVVFDAEKNGKKTQLESFETSPLEVESGTDCDRYLRVRRRATREMYECFNDADCDLGAVCRDAKCIVDVELTGIWMDILTGRKTCREIIARPRRIPRKMTRMETGREMPCDADDDNDALPDSVDNCPRVRNPIGR